MANNIIQFKDLSPKSSQQFIFDTNVWMFLYCPLADFKKEKQQNASKLLSYIISAQSKIIITSLILAEFSNAFLRLDFEQWRKLPENVSGKFKKDYFETNRSKETRNTIESSIKQILKIAERYPDNFNNININLILNAYKKVDFNDGYILLLSKTNNWNIITDDSDLEKVDIDITIIKI
jgi:predicted nucleic acid-binding protein